MAETNGKELAYRVFRDKTPVLDIYFDGSFKIRTDVPEEDRSDSAKGFHRVYSSDSTIEFQEYVQRSRERNNYYGKRQYAPPSDEYKDAYRTLQMFDQTPDYMNERVSRFTIVQVFGGAKVPWGRVDEGFHSGIVAAYIRGDGTVSAYFD